MPVKMRQEEIRQASVFLPYFWVCNAADHSIMASTTSTSRTVLLLSPHRIPEDHLVLESLHITRDAGTAKSTEMVRFESCELDNTELRVHYSQLPKLATEILMWFNTAGINWIREDIKKRFAAQRAGVPFGPYYKNTMTRRLHDLLERLKPFAPLLKWYHKLPGDKGYYKTAPCTFSAFKPQLHFELKQEDEGIQLETIITLNGSPYPISQFHRHHFLLESGNEYFLLSYKDYQTLEWLADNDPKQYAQRQEELAAQILSRLEGDYTVTRHDLLEKTRIRVAPVNRVMLSEISQSFLVLTPQWVYDGFPVDGPWKETQEMVRQGVTYLVERDRAAETAFLQLLESLHPGFSRQLNGYYYLSFAEAQKKQWFLKVYHRLLDLNIQLVGMDMLQHFRYSAHKIATEVVLLKEEKDIATLRMKVSFGDESILLSELQKMLRTGGRVILLKDGSLGVINDDWLALYGMLIRHGKIAKDELQVARWLAFSEIEVRRVLQNSWLDKWQRWQSGPDPLYPVPAAVQATMRPYQQKGFEWLLLLAEAGAGACLADDMGLGKTLQTICFLAHRIEEGGTHLIICPSSLIYNWQEELEKFAPSLKALVYHGAGRNAADLEKEQYHIVITSYGTVRSDIDAMSALIFDAVVLDESHNIKNPAAQITRAVGRLQAAIRVALSGTPVMNNTFDLYAQLDFLLPGLCGSREFFKREYADAIDRDNDPDKIRDLRKLTAPFILRRTKEQVAGDLPAKTEMVMWCDMSAAQKNIYDEVRDSIRSSLFLNIEKEGLNKNKLAVLQGMMKLRQLCNSPLLLPPEKQTCTDSVKTDMLLYELCNNLQNEKVLVFSQFARMLDLLAEACQKQNIAYYHFDGQTPPAKRAELVARFQEPGNTTNVFLISLKAGNAGLNLTAASYVFLFDPWWNTAVQQQAIDRTHRIGQTKNVFAYKMICKDTIEEKIIGLQQRKKQLADDLVSEDEGFVKSLSEEDIKYLFS
jgi:SNF2 family DNA or RNA helicase